MQALDAITIARLASDLHGWLCGEKNNAKINKIQQPTPNEFVLTLWGSGRLTNRQRLYIHLNPEAPVCFIAEQSDLQQLILPTLTKPTGFCMQLRKHLQNATVVDVTSLPGERVLNITFENYNELGNKVRLILSLELMGKHTNMLLVDNLQEIILGAAHPVTESMSRFREVASGLPYAPPPKPENRRLITEVSEAEFYIRLTSSAKSIEATLQEQFWGLGKTIVEEILTLENTPAGIYERLMQVSTGQETHPAIRADMQRFTLLGIYDLPTGSDDQWLPMPDVHTMVSSYFLQNLKVKRILLIQRRLLQQLQEQRKKLQRRQNEMTPVSQALIDDLQNKGDVLLTRLSAGELSASPSGGHITLSGFDGQMMDVEINPTLDWTDNAQLYYRRAKKERSRQNLLEVTRAQLEEQLAYLAQLTCMVEQAESQQDLLLLEAEMADTGWLNSKAVEKAKHAKKSAAKPGKKKQGALANDETEDELIQASGGVLRLQSSDGMEILVGKSGQANAQLSGKLAKPDDLWLHVHEMPGSHVLVKTRKQAVPNQTLLEASTLAVHFSTARQGKNVPVVFTESRYVRKIPDSYPGHVNYKNEKTVFITVDDQLLDQLLQARPD